MENKKSPLTNTCNFMNVKPIMMDRPYPPIQVQEPNYNYALLLSHDYCGSVSEMTAITQYINNENRLSCEKCPIAQTILGIAMSEMIHLQKLGELIYLLGGTIDFAAKQRNGRQQLWSPSCLNLQENAEQMLLAGIESEEDAISQYKAHIKMIGDKYVNAVLIRIIQDEEYHILMLQAMLTDYRSGQL